MSIPGRAPSKHLPGGVWPVMVTPFGNGGEMDRAGLDALVEWYIANGVTALYAWLCRHFSEYEAESVGVQNFLDAANDVISRRYPRSAKAYLGLDGVPIGATCRVSNDDLTEEDLGTLRQLRRAARQLLAGLPVQLHSGPS